ITMMSLPSSLLFDSVDPLDLHSFPTRRSSDLGTVKELVRIRRGAISVPQLVRILRSRGLDFRHFLSCFLYNRWKNVRLACEKDPYIVFSIHARVAYFIGLLY